MAKKTTTKLEVPPIVTRAQMLDGVREYTAADNSRRYMEAQLNLEIEALKKRYEGKLDCAVQTMAAYERALELWARREGVADAPVKSVETIHGIIGFRKGNPTTELLPKWTWKKVMETVKAFGLDKLFIRTKEEPDKEAFLAYRGQPIANPQNPARPLTIENLGVTVDQSERFFIEPKREEVAPEAAQ